MNDKSIVAGILIDENTTITFMEVCQTCHISEEQLLEMMEHGLLHHPATNVKKFHFDYNMVRRIESASRLQQDLGINSPGVVLALELLDELEQLRQELSMLQRHIENG